LQLAVEPPQLPSQWVPWNIFAGVKWTSVSKSPVETC
jgi:hypothetical protein